jgi:3-oxoadipate enol-lactonase
MPFADLGAVRLHYRFDGPENAPALVLSNSLGTTTHMWESVLPMFAASYRVLRYDTRGHGLSSVPRGEYSMNEIAEDLLRLLDHLAIERCSLCGISLGGVTAMWLGVYAPERVEKLILANTAARIGTVESWNERIRTIETLGLEVASQKLIHRWFTPDFMQRCGPVVEAIRSVLAATHPAGYTGCCAALRDNDLAAAVKGIRLPSLIIAGTYDPATTAAQGQALARSIPSSRYVELKSSHLSPVECAGDFGRKVLSFLQSEEGVR